MSSSNHWNSLAASLGADVPAETSAEEAHPAAPSPPSVARPVAPVERKSAAPRPTADWSGLASSLGITPVEPAPPAAEAKTTAAPQTPHREPPRAKSFSAEVTRLETKKKFGGDLVIESVETSVEITRVVHESAPASNRESGSARRDNAYVDEGIVDAELIDAEPIDADSDDAPGEHASGDTADRESRGDEERTGRRRRRRRRGGRRSRRQRDEANPEAGDAPSDERSADEVGGEQARQSTGFAAGFDDDELPLVPPELDVDPLAGIVTFDDEPAGETGETPAGEPVRERKRRRRRRRGSGRGRKPESETAADTDAASDSLDPLDDDDDHAMASVPAGEDDLDEEGSASGDRNSHRAIPSWDEAIGYIITVNMDSRNKNPKPSSPRGGRGRGRGGRGGARGNGQRRS